MYHIRLRINKLNVRTCVAIYLCTYVPRHIGMHAFCDDKSLYACAIFCVMTSWHSLHINYSMYVLYVA